MCCVPIHVLWLGRCMFLWLGAHRHVEERLNEEVVFFLYCTAMGHTYLSSSQCVSTSISLLFLGGEKICFCFQYKRAHRSIPEQSNQFSTKRPTSSAGIPGPPIVRHLHSPLPSLCSGRKRPRVEASTAATSHESTAWVSVCCLAASLCMEMSLELLPFYQMLMQFVRRKKK